MLAFWSENVKAGAPVSMQPPEEYVLHISQVALTPEAQGIGTKKKVAKPLAPHVVQVRTSLRTPLTASGRLFIIFGPISLSPPLPLSLPPSVLR